MSKCLHWQRIQNSDIIPVCELRVSTLTTIALSWLGYGSNTKTNQWRVSLNGNKDATRCVPSQYPGFNHKPCATLK